MDSNIDESQCVVIATEECCEDVSLEPHIQSQSEYTVYSNAQAPLSPDLASSPEEENDVQSRPDPQTQQASKLQWTLLSCL
jgi:hypothetical protein